MKRARPLSLRSKLTIAFLCCALIPLAATGMAIYYRTSDGLVRIEDQILASALTGAEDELANDQFRAMVPFISSRGLRRQVDAGDISGIRRELRAAVDRYGLMEIQLRDSSGRLLAREGHMTGPPQLPWALPDAAGRPTVRFTTILGEPYVVTAVRGTSRLATITLVWVRQVGDAMLASAAQRMGSRISIYTTVPQLPNASASPLTLAASSLQDSLRQDLLLVSPGEHRQGKGWTTAYERLGGDRDSAAVIAVGVPDIAFTSIRSSVGDALVVALLASLVVAVAVAVAIGRVVTRPLLTLSKAAGSIMSGVSRPQLEVRGTDELAVVARAFNEMSDRVAQRVESLSNEIQDLSRELGDLSLVGETLSQSADVFAALRPVADRVREMTHSELCAFLVDAPSLSGPLITAGDDGGSVSALEEVCRWVVDHQEGLTTNDLQRHPALSEGTSRQTRVTSVMAMPIVHVGRTVGVVLVGCCAIRRYSYETAAILSTVASQAATALANAAAYESLENGYLQTVTALASALEAKDEYTAEHAGSLGKMATAVGRALGLQGARLRQLQYAAVLHDVGKIGIRKEILEKAGPLTALERIEMERHTVIGESIVRRIEYLRPLATIIRAAHERWDGRGYPDGLAGERIRLESRIIFVCDAYHAMTSDRTYRPRLSRHHARRQLEVHSGGQFDPTVVAAFLELLDRGELENEGGEAHLALPQAAGSRDAAGDAGPIAPRELREALIGLAYEYLGVGVLLADDAGTLVDANPAFWRAVGREPAELIGRDALDVLDEHERKRCRELCGRLKRGGEQVVESLVQLSTGEDASRACLVRVSLTSSAPGLAPYFVAAVEDVTHRQRSESELRRLANEDHLTRLLNRRAFYAEAEARLLRAVRAARPAALLYIDVDGLKAINDRYGHASGDEALMRVAGSLAAVFRDADLVARIGGDEFAVLMVDTDVAAAAGALSRLEERLGSEAAAGSLLPTLTVSSGVAAFDPASPRSLPELVLEADREMYASKWTKQMRLREVPQLRRT